MAGSRTGKKRPKSRRSALVASRPAPARSNPRSRPGGRDEERGPARKTRRFPKAAATADGGRPVRTNASPKPDPVAQRVGHEIAKQLLKAYGYVEVKAESVLAEARARGLVVSTLEELRSQPLAKRDALQTTFVKSAKIWATSHGTTLGSAGLMTLAADVAALVAVNLRMVQQIAMSYGVEPAAERVDGWALLLSSLGVAIDVSATRLVEVKDAKALATKLLEETAMTFAKRLGKQAGRAVPIVGAVFGGLSNYAYTAEVGTRARSFYRELAP